MEVLVLDIFLLTDDSTTVWVQDHRENYVACSRNGEGFNDKINNLHVCELSAMDDDIVITISDF